MSHKNSMNSFKLKNNRFLAILQNNKMNKLSLYIDKKNKLFHLY